jgi:hypothetical protein
MRKSGTGVAIILLLLSFLTASLVFSPTRDWSAAGYCDAGIEYLWSSLANSSWGSGRASKNLARGVE